MSRSLRRTSSSRTMGYTAVQLIKAQNYEYMISEEITPFVKYNMFHAEMKRKRRNNPFLVENMFYNKELDFYVCPMGQHLELKGTKKETVNLAMSPPKAYIVQKTALNVL